ncbi:MAG: 3-isopropylmalate dehydratase small subunit [Candidatus Omnitrophota bacterium]|nr:MAG: 3-isopropylmalate dehydratase small subunit [Candidatus Omnitrophota bacterium]
MKYKGNAHKFGDNINTDDIIPARYLNTKEPAELGRHCMEGVLQNFAKKVNKGDIIVAGRNFGCGSSREHAPIAIQAAGISCIIAESFARIFYRNAINTGLPIIACEDAAKGIKNNNKVEVDTTNGIIRNVSGRKQYKSEKYPPFLQKIIKKGGLLNAIKR